jgi:hypothetical protein
MSHYEVSNYFKFCNYDLQIYFLGDTACISNCYAECHLVLSFVVVEFLVGVILYWLELLSVKDNQVELV